MLCVGVMDYKVQGLYDGKEKGTHYVGLGLRIGDQGLLV